MREVTVESPGSHAPSNTDERTDRGEDGDVADRQGETERREDAIALMRYVGPSAAARAVRENLRRIARSDASVLIHGGSGTGKEMAARIVHDVSPRRGGPFVPVDCGALAEGVLESELFGHARGAFTNAVGERRGLIEEAHGGTLFLDEIANTSRSLQARLLRVLQEREVRRVGCNRSRAVDVRVVAASNRDLAVEVLSGSFREDLLYRLDVLQLKLPLLRERREDVPPLARYLLDEIGCRAGQVYSLDPRVVATLMAHDWPGNVRELRNVLERAAAFAATGVLQVEHLPERLAGRVCADDRNPSLQAMLLSYERCVLADRLEANGWNRTRTARELAITRRCLFDKIGKHGLSPPGAAAAGGL